LGGLHVGARALAPAELPPVAERVAAAPSSATQEPRPTAEPRRSPASPKLPSVEPTPSEAPVPVVAPARTPTRAPIDAPRPENAKPGAARTPTPPPVAPDDLRAELALMDRAKTALATGDDAQVLRLVNEHAERFPEGSMVEERRGWTVIARCRSGAATSRSIAESFARDYPRSVLLDDIHHACSQHSATDSPPPSE
jgi:hypothetical protein